MKWNEKRCLTVVLAVFCLGATGCKLEGGENLEATIQVRASEGGGHVAQGVELPDDYDDENDTEDEPDEDLSEWSADPQEDDEERPQEPTRDDSGPIESTGDEDVFDLDEDEIEDDEPFLEPTTGCDADKDIPSENEPHIPETDEDPMGVEPSEGDDCGPNGDAESLQTCEADLEVCLEGNDDASPEEIDACHDAYDTCITEQPADLRDVHCEPHPEQDLENDPCQEDAQRCLDEVDGDDAAAEILADACFDAMDECYDKQDENLDDVPSHASEFAPEALCEGPLNVCLEAAGDDEVQADVCFETFDTCVEEKLPVDPDQQQCFDDFQVCVEGLGEDDEAEFTLCMETEIDCLGGMESQADDSERPLFDESADENRGPSEAQAGPDGDGQEA